MFISACASLKIINPFAEIKVEDTEPRVTFIDKRETKVEPSKLPKINPEQVVASYQRLLSRGSPQVRMEALRRLADLTMRLAESKMALDEDVDLTKLNPRSKELRLLRLFVYTKNYLKSIQITKKPLM